MIRLRNTLRRDRSVISDPAFAEATADRSVNSDLRERKAPSEPRPFMESKTRSASSGFVSRQLPAALDRYLTALPAMSLIPVAPFLSYHTRLGSRS